MLVAAMNPALAATKQPSGKGNACAPGVVKYLNRIRDPLLDRIDIHIEVTPWYFSELSSESGMTEKKPMTYVPGRPPRDASG